MSDLARQAETPHKRLPAARAGRGCASWRSRAGLARPRTVVGVGTLKALLALGVLGLVPTFGYSLEGTRAVAFHMAVGQLFLTYASRHTWMRPLANPYLHAAVVGGVAIQFAAAFVPAISNLLGNAAPSRWNCGPSCLPAPLCHGGCLK
jgi:hypothetical protein